MSRPPTITGRCEQHRSLVVPATHIAVSRRSVTLGLLYRTALGGTRMNALGTLLWDSVKVSRAARLETLTLLEGSLTHMIPIRLVRVLKVPPIARSAFAKILTIIARWPTGLRRPAAVGLRRPAVLILLRPAAALGSLIRGVFRVVIAVAEFRLGLIVPRAAPAAPSPSTAHVFLRAVVVVVVSLGTVLLQILGRNPLDTLRVKESPPPVVLPPLAALMASESGPYPSLQTPA